MSKAKELRYYTTARAKKPFIDGLKKIKDLTTRSRIERRLERLELGNYGDYKPLEEGVYELRLDFGAGYRVYFTELGEVIILLLCVGKKSTQQKDIETAKKYWRDFKERFL